jgi:hypothetical protein
LTQSDVGVLNGVLYAIAGENSIDGVLATNEAFTPPHTFIGFLQPIDNPPVANTGKAGSTYPVKWQLRDAGGNYVTNLNAVTSIKYLAVTCGEFAGDPTSALETTATGGTSLRYDSTANQFVYNWATPGAGCYVLFVTLNDSTVHRANFKLTK